MTSHDVRDMLDLPQEGAPRPAKKQKLAGPRPVLKGLAREVQNLGGDNPIAIVPEVSVFKKRRFMSRKPASKWELVPFKNTARSDQTLILRHWRRKEASPPPTVIDENEGESSEAAEKPTPVMDDSTFAKFNVQINIPDYTDDEYNSRLASPGWSRDETDYLMKVISDFDVRWPLIWDRYEYEPPQPRPVEGDAAVNTGAIIVPPKARTMEDLKLRYYSIAATIMALRKPPIKMNSAEFNLHEVMQNFDAKQEHDRKKFAEAAFKRTREEAREEESLLLELKRILARSDKLNEDRRELYARLEAPPSTGNIGIFSTSGGLQQLLQQLMTADKSKKQRKLTLGGETMSPAVGASGQTQQNFDRRESSVRESISGPSGGNNKKGNTQNAADRRQLTEEEERIYGVSRHERLGTSGPTFRHDKITKPLVSKSAVQQAKIGNILGELEIAGRLIMPTAEVGEAYEGLLQSINVLLDARKVADKLAGEIATAKAHRAEKKRLARAESTNPTANGDGEIKREGSAVASVRAGSVQRKRSASVMSAISDKSTKRQKK
ncbi:putative SWR1-complex protein 4 [Amylocarpus encephaloides]|uniref:SWR1-complex protein 4 n=1 Tax=Amylocarpus encephaloides TaxID=45428 RepID=A0A9P8C576_9HELO|nr:putative SWR1-complex protein 4 [Amylocarpus encephaloides]